MTMYSYIFSPGATSDAPGNPKALRVKLRYTSQRDVECLELSRNTVVLEGQWRGEERNSGSSGKVQTFSSSWTAQFEFGGIRMCPSRRAPLKHA